MRETAAKTGQKQQRVKDDAKAFERKLVKAARSITTCTYDGCKLPSSLLSSPPRCALHLEDYEAWVRSVEREKTRMIQVFAREGYVVALENFHPVFGPLYKRMSGTLPNVHAYMPEIPTFIALSAMSGIIGNFAYDVFKKIVFSVLGKAKARPLERILPEELYEEARRALPAVNLKPDAATVEELEITIKLNYRLLIESKASRKGKD
jgi:hypothetical protein